VRPRRVAILSIPPVCPSCLSLLSRLNWNCCGSEMSITLQNRFASAVVGFVQPILIGGRTAPLMARVNKRAGTASGEYERSVCRKRQDPRLELCCSTRAREAPSMT
jgi:hypothetical protein